MHQRIKAGKKKPQQDQKIRHSQQLPNQDFNNQSEKFFETCCWNDIENRTGSHQIKTIDYQAEKFNQIYKINVVQPPDVLQPSHTIPITHSLAGNNNHLSSLIQQLHLSTAHLQQLEQVLENGTNQILSHQQSICTIRLFVQKYQELFKKYRNKQKSLLILENKQTLYTQIETRIEQQNLRVNRFGDRMYVYLGHSEAIAKIVAYADKMHFKSVLEGVIDKYLYGLLHKNKTHYHYNNFIQISTATHNRSTSNLTSRPKEKQKQIKPSSSSSLISSIQAQAKNNSGAPTSSHCDKNCPLHEILNFVKSFKNDKIYKRILQLWLEMQGSLCRQIHEYILSYYKQAEPQDPTLSPHILSTLLAKYSNYNPTQPCPNKSTLDVQFNRLQHSPSDCMHCLNWSKEHLELIKKEVMDAKVDVEILAGEIGVLEKAIGWQYSLNSQCNAQSVTNLLAQYIKSHHKTHQFPCIKKNSLKQSDILQISHYINEDNEDGGQKLGNFNSSQMQESWRKALTKNCSLLSSQKNNETGKFGNITLNKTIMQGLCAAYRNYTNLIIQTYLEYLSSCPTEVNNTSSDTQANLSIISGANFFKHVKQNKRTEFTLSQYTYSQSISLELKSTSKSIQLSRPQCLKAQVQNRPFKQFNSFGASQEPINKQIEEQVHQIYNVALRKFKELIYFNLKMGSKISSIEQKIAQTQILIRQQQQKIQQNKKNIQRSSIYQNNFVQKYQKEGDVDFIELSIKKIQKNPQLSQGKKSISTTKKQKILASMAVQRPIQVEQQPQTSRTSRISIDNIYKIKNLSYRVRRLMHISNVNCYNNLIQSKNLSKNKYSGKNQASYKPMSRKSSKSSNINLALAPSTNRIGQDCQNLQNYSNQRMLEFSKNKLILRNRVSPHFHQQIQIKRIVQVRMQITGVVSLGFRKGYMTLEFLDDSPLASKRNLCRQSGINSSSNTLRHAYKQNQQKQNKNNNELSSIGNNSKRQHQNFYNPIYTKSLVHQWIKYFKTLYFQHIEHIQFIDEYEKNSPSQEVEQDGRFVKGYGHLGMHAQKQVQPNYDIYDKNQAKGLQSYQNFITFTGQPNKNSHQSDQIFKYENIKVCPIENIPCYKKIDYQKNQKHDERQRNKQNNVQNQCYDKIEYGINNQIQSIHNTHNDKDAQIDNFKRLIHSNYDYEKTRQAQMNNNDQMSMFGITQTRYKQTLQYQFSESKQQQQPYQYQCQYQYQYSIKQSACSRQYEPNYQQRRYHEQSQYEYEQGSPYSYKHQQQN